MIASWMLYALLVSALVATAAWVLEEVCRLIHAPVRWVWLGALLAMLGMVALAPLRTAAPDQLTSIPAAVLAPSTTGTSVTAPQDWLSSVLGTVSAGTDALAQPLRAAVLIDEGAIGNVLAIGWIVLSLTFLCLAAATLLRSRRARRKWPVREIAGTPVRVAQTTGPAVLGLRRPEVVIPEWLLQAPMEEQRLVVLHEQEHIRARDPLVLAAGCLSVALIPWNPLAWWMLFRLRLAVELDCDVRVLRGGVRPLTYGSLLITMAGRGSGISLGAPALAGSPSTLERRLTAMTTRLPRFAAARACALGTIGLAALVAACETRMPTAPDIEEMDVAAAETQAKQFALVASKDGKVTYFVDGKQVSAEEARALGGDKITRMEMVRAQTGEGAEFRVTTRMTGVSAGDEHAADRVHIVGNISLDTPGKGKQIILESTQAGGTETHRLLPAGGDFPGLLFIDGVLAQPSLMRTLNPDQIEKIEVVKGAAAAKLHSDPKAANGVIRITTKAGATKR